MITVVIVDDSPTARTHLRRTLESDPGLLVVAEAANGREAMHLIKKFEPKLVTMDVVLKNENGLDVAGAIMSESPRPIIVVTGVNASDPDLVYKAMDRGAIEVLPKLPPSQSPEYAAAAERLVRLAKTLSQVPVATRWNRRGSRPAPAPAAAAVPRPTPLPRAVPRPASRPAPRARLQPRAEPEVLLLGASTGGPPVLNKIISSLKSPFPVPVVVVQHISEGFGVGFVQWLEEVTGRPCVLVLERMLLKPGNVYISPDNRNIVFSSKRYIADATPAPTDRIIPSINAMFESGARCFGPSAVGVLLTGMGKDGAEGLRKMRDAGASTIVQSPDTCAVASMPETAISLDAVDTTLDPVQIYESLNRIIG